MNKKILFRCDSSSLIGHGHVRRCLVLAQQCEAQEINFATRQLDGDINHLIEYKKFRLTSNDIQELIDLIKSEKFDLLILDHYDISYEDEKKIKESTQIKILSFDDTYKKHYCDILLNHNIGAKKEKYSALSPSFTRHLCGEQYTLIHPNFHYKKLCAQAREHLDIYLSFGGTDPFNLLERFIKDFKNMQYNFHITTTSANQSLQKLKRLALLHKNFKLYVDEKNIAQVLQKCDFAISTPSVSIAEILKMQIPFLAIKVADNQNEIYNYLKNRRFFTLARYEKAKIQTTLHHLDTVLPIYRRRKILFKSTKKLCQQLQLN